MLITALEYKVGWVDVAQASALFCWQTDVQLIIYGLNFVIFGQF